MTTLTLPSQTPPTLRRLCEYVTLFQSYTPYLKQNQLPPLPIRIRFKRCESFLPTGIVQYTVWLLKTGIKNPLTTMDEKGRCSICKNATHPEWRTSIARGEIVFICGRCKRVFVPTSKT